jgi:serine O-acetyltransferase
MRFVYRHFLAAPLHELGHPPRSQVPMLDVLRTVAVVSVIVSHLTSAFVKQGGNLSSFAAQAFYGPARLGLGVDLFFVLSGYLIGKQLWRELRDTGRIDVLQFWLRRGFRIWPLYFCFLVFVIAVLGRGSFPFGKWWSDAAFLTNYVNQGVVMGSWSLCTEEQFYTITPLILLLIARSRNWGFHIQKCLIALLLLLPLVRALTWWQIADSLREHSPALYMQYLYTPFHTHCDSLVMGLLIAHIAVTDPKKMINGKRAAPWLMIGATLTFFVLYAIHKEIFTFSSWAFIGGSAVWFGLTGKHRWLSFAQSRFFYIISRLSYGMYLNHEYMHEEVSELVIQCMPWAYHWPSLQNGVACCVLVAISAGAALITFCLIEHPFLALRELYLAKKRDRSASIVFANAPVPIRNRVDAALPNAAYCMQLTVASSLLTGKEQTVSLLSTILTDLRAKARWCYTSERWMALLKVLLTDGTPAMILYRLMQWARRWRLTPLEMIFNKLNAVLCNCIIGRGAEFGPGLVLIHSTGVVINGQVRGGANIHIEHQVTIGAERRQSPILGNDVFLGAGAKILGSISLGDGVRIGANAVVLDDIPAYCTAVGIPARIVRCRTPHQLDAAAGSAEPALPELAGKAGVQLSGQRQTPWAESQTPPA